MQQLALQPAGLAQPGPVALVQQLERLLLFFGESVLVGMRKAVEDCCLGDAHCAPWIARRIISHQLPWSA